jgi:hypothetical protein
MRRRRRRRRRKSMEWGWPPLVTEGERELLLQGAP